MVLDLGWTAQPVLGLVRWLYVLGLYSTRGLALVENSLRRPDFLSDHSLSDYQASLCEVTSETRLRMLLFSLEDNAARGAAGSPR